MATDNGTTLNGTESRVEADLAKLEAEKAKADAKAKAAEAKAKAKKGRGMLLFSFCKKNGDPKKTKTKGFVFTADLGEVDVTLQTFPESFKDEDYQEAADGAGLAIKFDLEGRKVSGINLTSGTTKVIGEAALDFLEKVQDTDDE